jgi:hypothetical protein
VCEFRPLEGRPCQSSSRPIHSQHGIRHCSQDMGKVGLPPNAARIVRMKQYSCPAMTANDWRPKMPPLCRVCVVFGGLVCFAMPRSHLTDLVIIDRICAPKKRLLAYDGVSRGLGGVRRRGPRVQKTPVFSASTRTPTCPALADW